MYISKLYQHLIHWTEFAMIIKLNKIKNVCVLYVLSDLTLHKMYLFYDNIIHSLLEVDGSLWKMARIISFIIVLAVLVTIISIITIVVLSASPFQKACLKEEEIEQNLVRNFI